MAMPGTRQPSTQRQPLRGRFLDPKFRAHMGHYVLQCIAATAAIFVVLSVLDGFSQTVLVAALGASAFVAFTMPWVNASRPRYLLGGYLVGIVVGGGVSAIAGLLMSAAPQVLTGALPMAFGALATGLAIFVMVVTDTEHPPAAGLALGFVLNGWDPLTALVVFAGVAAISFIKETFKSSMMDLL